MVVLDVDSCCDPTDDEGDPAGDQVEPAGRGSVSAHLEPAGEHGMGSSRRANPVQPLEMPPWGRGRGKGGRYRSMGLGAAWDVSLSGCCGAFQVTSL